MDAKRSILNNKNLLFERINSDFKSLTGLNTVNDIIDKAVDMISEVWGAEQVAFFIKDPTLLQVFELEDTGIVNHIRLDNQTVSIVLPNWKVKSKKKLARTDDMPTDLDSYLDSPDGKHNFVNNKK